MVKKLGLSVLLLAIMGNGFWTSSARGNFLSNLTVEINGLRNTEGQVCVSIFANSKGFPNNRDGVLKAKCTKMSEKSLTVTFDNLQAGSYAVAVIHDQNNDQILNLNYFGVPIEGFGFSRNPEVRIGPPKFRDTAFLLAGPNTVIQIKLKHL